MSHLRKVHSNARPGNRSGWGRNNPSGSRRNRRNRRDDEQDNRQQQSNKEQTWVSLISDDEEDGEGIVSPSRKRNVSHVDNPRNSPARKRVASGPVSGNNSSSFPAAGSTFAATDVAIRLSPAPQGRNTVNQLAAQLHQKQNENAQLMEKIDDIRLASTVKDAEIASLREIIEGMQQAPTNNSAHDTAHPVQHNVSRPEVHQPASGHQKPWATANPPCSTCAETSALTQKLADAQFALSKARNTVVNQHDQIKALMEQADSNKKALLEERAAIAQHKLSIDQLRLQVVTEQATVKNLESTLAENRAVIDHLSAKLSAQGQDLNASRATIIMNESTIADFEDKLAAEDNALDGGFEYEGKAEKVIEKLNMTIEDLKRQVANSQASLHDARTTIFVNGTAIQDLKAQVAGSQGSALESATKAASKVVEELKLKLKEAEPEIEKLTARAERAEMELEELTKTYEKEREKMESLRNDLRTAWEKDDKIKTEAESRLLEFKKKERELADLKTQFEQQQEKLTQCELKVEQQQQTFDHEKENLRTLMKSLRDELEHKEAERVPEMDALSKKVESLNEQLFNMESERDQLAKEVEKRTDNEILQNWQTQAIRSAFEISQAHVNSLKNQLDVKSVQFADLEERVKSLQAELDAAANRTRVAEQETAQMKSQFDQYTKETNLKQQQAWVQHSQALQQLNDAISQLQERNWSLEVSDQAHIIRTMKARIVELQLQLELAQGSGNQTAFEAQVAHLQSQLQQKNDVINSINEQLERVFNQYQELSDERAEDRKKIADLEQRNHGLGEHFQRMMAERSQALQDAADLKVALTRAETDIQSSDLQPNQPVGPHLQALLAERDEALWELAETKEALRITEIDLEFTKRQADAIDEGGDLEFAYMESAWEPKLRDAQAQHEAAAKERDEALQRVSELTGQLQAMSKEGDELHEQLEASRVEVAELQAIVEDLSSQLSKTDSGINPVVKETLDKAKRIQTASDISKNRAQRAFLSSMRSIDDEDEDQFLMPVAPLPESTVNSAKKEELQKMVRDLVKSHEITEVTVRRLITRLKWKTIKTHALEKELKVCKGILQTKDRLINQATARLSGTFHGDAGVANSEDDTMMDVDVEFKESGGEDELEQAEEPEQEAEPEQEHVDLEDVDPSQKTLVITFGPTRRGYKVWKAEGSSNDYDRFEENTSYALKVAFMTNKGKNIHFVLRQYSNLPGDPAMLHPPSSASPASTTATQSADESASSDETHSVYTASQETSTSVRTNRTSLPPLRSAPGSAAPQVYHAPPVEFGPAHGRGTSVWTSSQNEPPSTQVSSQALISAVYPAPPSTGHSRGRSARGRYATNRFRLSIMPTMAGPSQPRRHSVPASTTQNWAAEDVDMDVLASQFTMESIEAVAERETEPESPWGKGKGKQRVTRGSHEEF